MAYFVTSFQIAAISIVFMRDKREKKLVPDAVIWWGWVTFASFFAVSAIPFVTTGPLAFNGVISFWIAFFTWFFWIPTLSYFIIKAIDRTEGRGRGRGARERLVAVEVVTTDRVKPRRLPGVDGVWVFIGADSVIFAILFVSFMQDRLQNPAVFEASRQTLNMHLGGIDTLILLTSSWSVALAVQAMKRDLDRPRAPPICSGERSPV